MQSSINTQTTVTLVFTQAEAELLAGYMQNPMCPPEQEPDDIRKLRQDIFYAICPPKPAPVVRSA